MVAMTIWLDTTTTPTWATRMRVAHVMVHAPAADVAEAYRKAYEHAQPEPGGAVVVLDCERVLVLSDATVEPTGELSPDNDRQGWGGNVRLVSGVAEPEVMVAGGQVERWRVINASSARYVKLSIAGRMPDDRPGEWMYHCHILEHHAAGMMAHFRVVRGASDHEPSQVSPHVQVHNEAAR